MLASYTKAAKLSSPGYADGSRRRPRCRYRSAYKEHSSLVQPAGTISRIGLDGQVTCRLLDYPMGTQPNWVEIVDLIKS
jgi:hypothetical protein